MRKCKNPSNCKFGTSADEHMKLSEKEADSLNEKVVEEQMNISGIGVAPSVARTEPLDEEDSESIEDLEHRILVLDERIQRYSENNLREAVTYGQALIDSASTAQKLNPSYLQKVIYDSLDSVDSADIVSNNEIARDQAQRFSAIEDNPQRLKAAKKTVIHGTKELAKRARDLQNERDSLKENLAEARREKELELHSEKEKRFESQRSGFHNALVSSGLNEAREGAAEREAEPFNEEYTAPDGSAHRAKQMNLPDTISDTLTSHGFPVQNIYEIESTPEAANAYRDAALEFKKDNPFHASLHVYDAEEYENQRIFLADDGNSGFVLKESDSGKRDEVVTVFSTKSAPKGAAYQMMTQAVAEGGSRLDCYNTVLPSIYSSVGFREYDYWDWDDEYKPDDWDYDTYSAYNGGRPGVVLMEWSPDYEPARSVQDTRSTEERKNRR